ncbi:MAG: hypothetical protein HY744_26445 [Deltaproteobacteria bacterium]|nr:hypothetical protein [Deltaproteobacteria bacterium]
MAGAVAIAAVAWILRPWPPAAERAVGSAPAASPGTSARSKPGKPDGGRPPARRVRVQVVPSGAAVTVGGKPAQAPGGFLLLEGEPGDSFLVVAKDGTRKAEAKVIITKDGEPSLPAIEVPRAWSELRRPGSGKAEPGPEPPGTPSAPAAAAVPTATAGPSAAKPQAKEEW